MIEAFKETMNINDEITSEGIKKHINCLSDIILKDVTESTNKDAKELGIKGAKEGTLIISKMQTSGRGRMERKFFSPNGSGIYMSVLLRPKMAAEKSLLVTTAAAVSVSDALDEILNINTQIKWVNDIYLNNKKVCGILAESVFSGDESFCVLGIGINVYPPLNGFPEDIENKAGFLTESLQKDLKNRIVAGVLEKFFMYYENLENKEFYESYKNKNFLKDRYVEVPGKGTAKVIDIDDEFRLVAEFEDKTITALMTGEVVINL